MTTQNGCPDSIFSIYCARNQCECTGSVSHRYRANDETRDEDDHPVAWFEQQSVATTHYISPTTHYISPSSEHTRIVVISADRFEDNLGTENRAEGRDTITRSANVGEESLRLILVLLG